MKTKARQILKAIICLACLGFVIFDKTRTPQDVVLSYEQVLEATELIFRPEMDSIQYVLHGSFEQLNQLADPEPTNIGSLCPPDYTMILINRKGDSTLIGEVDCSSSEYDILIRSNVFRRSERFKINKAMMDFVKSTATQVKIPLRTRELNTQEVELGS